MESKASKHQENLNEINSFLLDFSKNVAITESDIGNQNIIFSNLSNNVYIMNVTGKLIWHTLKYNTKIEDLHAMLSSWFTAGIEDEKVMSDLLAYLKELETEKLLFVGGEKTKGDFPFGREIQITQNQSDVPYESPVIMKYDREILRAKHPEVFFRTQFSDTWGPSTSGGRS